MLKPIQISEQSLRLIQELHKHDATLSLLESNEQILNWLKSTEQPKENRFLYESLRLSLLTDVYYLFLTQEEKQSLKAPPKNWSNYIGVSLIALGGIIFAICDGFDGMSSILGLFTSIPNWAIFFIGTAFGIFSATVFYCLYLVHIAENLGVPFKKTSQLLDVLVDQFEQIKLIRKKIAILFRKNQDNQQALDDYLLILSILSIRYDELQKLSDIYNNEDSIYLTCLKFIISCISGILFFSYGFFAGQSFALAVSNLLFATISLTSWPVLLVSICVGLASLSVYWCSDRLSLDNFVGRWMGLDPEQIELLSDSNKKQFNKLESLTCEIQEKRNFLDTHAVKSLSSQSMFMPKRSLSLNDIEFSIHNSNQLKFA